MAVITGTPGTTINAQCLVSNDGQPIDFTESSATAQSIVDDLATIGAGNVAIAGNKTFSGNTAFGSAPTLSTPLSITRAQGAPVARTGTWTPSATTAGIVAGGTGGGATFEVQPPHGSKLTDVRVWILPNTGHAGLPTVRPQIQLVTIANTGGVTAIATQSDLTLNVVTYENNHAIAITGLNHTVDRSAFRYAVFYSDEASTNALSGGLLYYCELTYEVTTLGLD